MNDGFRVRIRLELVTLGCELLLQLLEVLDDSIVDDGDPTVHMRMGIALDGPAVSRPPRMPDASTTLQRLLPQPHLEVLELAFRAAPVEVTVLNRRDASRVVAAVFQPPEGVDKVRRHGFRAENAHDPAHLGESPCSCAVLDLILDGTGHNSNLISWYFLVRSS